MPIHNPLEETSRVFEDAVNSDTEKSLFLENAPESDGGTEIPAIPKFNIYSNGNVDLIGTQFEGKNFNTIRIQWAQQQANIADTFTSAVDNQGRTITSLSGIIAGRQINIVPPLEDAGVLSGNDTPLFTLGNIDTSIDFSMVGGEGKDGRRKRRRSRRRTRRDATLMKIVWALDTSGA